MVLALNMMDEVRANGGTIDVQKLSDDLGIPWCHYRRQGRGCVRADGPGGGDGENRVLPKVYDFCAANSPVHRCVHAVVHLIEDHADGWVCRPRFCATKLIEGDRDMADRLVLDQNERELLEHCIVQMETENGLDRNASLADMRYTFIEQVTADAVVKCHESKGAQAQRGLGQGTDGEIHGAAGILWRDAADLLADVRCYWARAQRPAGAGYRLRDRRRGRALTAYGINPVVHSLIIDGIFAGVGSVLSFLPIIVTLFFLPVHSGGHRLHGPGGLCHGQAAAEDRSVRTEHRTAADRLRLLGAGYHGHPHGILGPGSEDDHSADALYELLGQDPHLWLFYRRVFSPTTRRW